MTPETEWKTQTSNAQDSVINAKSKNLFKVMGSQGQSKINWERED
jgi:hypothetical protein